jgi:hypothetical protein
MQFHRKSRLMLGPFAAQLEQMKKQLHAKEGEVKVKAALEAERNDFAAQQRALQEQKVGLFSVACASSPCSLLRSFVLCDWRHVCFFAVRR